MLLACLMVGCSGYSRITTSDGNDYAVYQDGKEICKSSRDCKLYKESSKDKFLLEVRRDEIAYGHLFVACKKSSNGFYLSGGLGDIKGNNVAGLFLIEFPLYMINVVGSFSSTTCEIPDQITIPVVSPKKSLAPFPWGEPAKD